EENLRHQTAKAMSDDDRRSFEFANNLLVVIDNVGQSKFGEAARIATQLLDIAFPAGPVRGDDTITLVSVMLDPELPTERTDPKAIDKNNRGDVHGEYPPERASFSPGNASGGQKLNAARLLMSSGLCLSLDSLT